MPFEESAVVFNRELLCSYFNYCLHLSDALSQSSETGLKLSHEDIKARPPGDSRLRPPDQRGRNAPSSPHRKISRDPLPYQKELMEAKKAAEVAKKVRKDSVHRAPPKDEKCRGTTSMENISQKEADTSNRSGRKVSLPKYGNVDQRNESSDKVLDIGELIKMSPSNVCKASGLPPSSNATESEDKSVVNNAAGLDKSAVRVVSVDRQDHDDCVMADSDAMQKSHNSDDFDCPCCDRTVTLVDGPMSDSEIHVFTSCDVVPWPSENNEELKEDKSDKVRLNQF